MAPSRRKGASKAAAAARRQWKVGDLVLAKVKGFPAWPATVWQHFILPFFFYLLSIENLCFVRKYVIGLRDCGCM